MIEILAFNRPSGARGLPSSNPALLPLRGIRAGLCTIAPPALPNNNAEDGILPEFHVSRRRMRQTRQAASLHFLFYPRCNPASGQLGRNLITNLYLFGIFDQLA